MTEAEEVVGERMWNYLAPSGDKKVRCFASFLCLSRWGKGFGVMVYARPPKAATTSEAKDKLGKS